MSTFVAISYDNPTKAEEVRLELFKLQSNYLIEMEDAVVAVKDEKGKVKLHQTVNMAATGALSGGFFGTLIGMLFLSPFLGMALGASAGAISGAITDAGINDQFMKDLAGKLQPNSSVLFVLIRSMTADKVVDDISQYGGTVLKTSLSHLDEEKLQAALDQHSAANPSDEAPAE